MGVDKSKVNRIKFLGRRPRIGTSSVTKVVIFEPLPRRDYMATASVESNQREIGIISTSTVEERVPRYMRRKIKF